MGFLDFLKKKSSPEDTNAKELPPLNNVGGVGDLPPLDSNNLPPLDGSMSPPPSMAGNSPSPDNLFPDYSTNSESGTEASGLPDLSPAPEPHPDVGPTPQAAPEIHTETVSHNKLPAFDDSSSVDADGAPKELEKHHYEALKKTASLFQEVFVEKEHYAYMLDSLKSVRNDLQERSAQHSRLVSINTKLTQQYQHGNKLFADMQESLMDVEAKIFKEGV